MSDAHVRPARFSAEEWEARVRLAACYRIFAHLGWAELICKHILRGHQPSAIPP